MMPPDLSAPAKEAMKKLLGISANVNTAFATEYSRAEKARLEKKIVMGFWETLPDGRIVMRIATSWATTEENVEKYTVENRQKEA